MNGFVQVPSKGQPMTAQWGADVANGLNAIRSAGQSGMLLTDGPTGTGFATLPANLRDRRVSPMRYWTFSCTEDPDTHKRTGGWQNCKLQIGYNCSVEDKCTKGERNPRIKGTDLTDDGTYYVEVDVKNETAEIKKMGGSSDLTLVHDLENDKVNVYIGKVNGGKQVDGIYCIPVIPKYV